MTETITTEAAVREFSKRENAAHSRFVACMYWCDDVWPICVCDTEAAARYAAERYMKMWPHEFKDGFFVNGHGAENFWIMEVPYL